MTSTQEVSKILHDNLFHVFGEEDYEKRLASLSQLWVADSECIFIDPMGIFRTHKDISDFIGKLLGDNVGKVFTVRGVFHSVSLPLHWPLILHEVQYNYYFTARRTTFK